MDLYIKITDENGELLQSVNIYQDGSDSDGALEIKDWLDDNYSTEPSTWSNTDPQLRRQQQIDDAS